MRRKKTSRSAVKTLSRSQKTEAKASPVQATVTGRVPPISPPILDIVRSIKEALTKDAADIEIQLARFTLVEDFAKVTTIQEPARERHPNYVT
jgi:hypothetical protein